MRFDPTRLAILAFGDRLVAAVVQRRRIDTFVVEAEAPAAALRAELDQRHVGARSAFVGLPRSAVTVKPIDLPAVDGELTDMVRFELERHLPFGGEETPFDFLPLAPGGEGGARRVLIAAADRRLVDATLRVVDEAKLRPVSLTVAAHNLPALASRPRQGHVVWVHRSGDVADLLFLEGGALVLSRTVTEADDELLTEEIRRSFAVTRWRGCDAVWISGDVTAGAAVPLRALGAPVSEPPYTAAARRLLGGVTESPRGLLELAVAVAAAPKTRPLELLPLALRPRRLTRAQLVTVGLAGLAVVLAAAALLVPGWREGRRLADVNARIARLDPEVRAVEKVMQELERKRRLLATVQSIESSSVRPLPVLRELTELLPTDAWLTMLAFDVKGVELTGQAGAAAALIPLLENSPRLERVEFSSPVTRGRDREQFRIRAAWEGGSAVVAAAPRAGAAVPPAGAPLAPPRGAPPAPAPPPSAPPGARAPGPLPPAAGVAPGAQGPAAPPVRGPGVPAPERPGPLPPAVAPEPQAPAPAAPEPGADAPAGQTPKPALDRPGVRR